MSKMPETNGGHAEVFGFPFDPMPFLSRGVVEKMISHSSFHLKGSGWYVTDYGRKGSSAPEGKKSEPADKPASAAESSTPAVPAPKADPA